jgi:soluble lytic murein transglycosylase-like protein
LHLTGLSPARERRGITACLLFIGALLLNSLTHAGAQKYEPLSASVQASLSKTISDRAVDARFLDTAAARAWVEEMSRRLARKLPDPEYREDLLGSVYYEAHRAGLEPDMILGLMDVESGFRKYAVSSAGARGYMQVMPFWVELIGTPEHNLFHMRTNLKYGCTILRHYLDIEKGDLFRALGRYNGSLGRAEYPNMVLAAWKKRWSYAPDPNAPEAVLVSQGRKG